MAVWGKPLNHIKAESCKGSLQTTSMKKEYNSLQSYAQHIQSII